MSERILNNEMDEAAERLVNKIRPILTDAMARAAIMTFTYDEEKWNILMTAMTVKLPHMLKDMPLNKESRMEVLGLLDFLDRGMQQKGNEETAKSLFTVLVMMADFSAIFRNYIQLRAYEGLEEITHEVFEE